MQNFLEPQKFINSVNAPMDVLDIQANILIPFLCEQEEGYGLVIIVKAFLIQ